MPRWSKGRVALVGAYVLAGELSRHTDHTEAFAAYERVMRPLVTLAQDVPSLGPKVAMPKTRVGIVLQHIVGGVASRLGLFQFFGRFATPPADAIQLPDYGVGASAWWLRQQHSAACPPCSTLGPGTPKFTSSGGLF